MVSQVECRETKGTERNLWKFAARSRRLKSADGSLGECDGLGGSGGDSQGRHRRGRGSGCAGTVKEWLKLPTSPTGRTWSIRYCRITIVRGGDADRIFIQPQLHLEEGYELRSQLVWTRHVATPGCALYSPHLFYTIIEISKTIILHGQAELSIGRRPRRAFFWPGCSLALGKGCSSRRRLAGGPDGSVSK